MGNLSKWLFIAKGCLLFISCSADTGSRSPTLGLESDKTSQDSDASNRINLPSYIGRGFDDLTGLEKEFCLDYASVQVGKQPLKNTESTLEIVRSQSDLENTLDVGVNLDFSGVFDMFTPSVSLSTNVVRKSLFSENQIKAVAQLVYRAESMNLGQGIQKASIGSSYNFDPSNTDDVLAFRNQCGDRYVDEVTLGSRLVIVFNAEHSTEETLNRTDVETALRLGIASIFNVGIGVSVSDEQKAILSNLNISTECYSEGAVDPDFCGAFDIKLEEGEDFLDKLREYFVNVRTEFASLSENPDNHVVLSRTFNTYPDHPTKNSPYYSVSDRQNHLTELMSIQQEVEDICNNLTIMDGECSVALSNIKTEVRKCAEQSTWVNECNDLYSVSEYRKNYLNVIDADNVGTISVYEHPDFTGRKLDLVFNQVFSQDSDTKYQVIYSLHDSKYSFGDIISAIEFNLKPGWRVEFFEHPDGTGRSFVYEGQGSLADIGSVGGVHDIMSAFKLSYIKSE